MPSWSDLNKRRKELPDAPPDEDADQIIARVLMTDDGKLMLAWLRARTIEHLTPLGAPDAVLREAAGARRLVADIEQAAARGHVKLAKPAA